MARPSGTFRRAGAYRGFGGEVTRSALALFLLAAPLAAAAPPSPPVVDYTISVSLDPKAKTLDGTERLVWHNPSADAIPELRFHLYLNAFKNNRTTFMRESGGQLRGDEAGKKPEDWGWIDVASMKTPDGTDLRKTARFIQPDGNDPSDETVLLVPLSTRSCRRSSRARATSAITSSSASGSPRSASTSRPGCGIVRPAAGTVTRSTRTPSSTRTTGAST
jgi:hypothetical protein